MSINICPLHSLSVDILIDILWWDHQNVDQLDMSVDKKNQMRVPGRTVEVKLLCNFSKIVKICDIFPNKGTLLNHVSWMRSYECNSFTDLLTHWLPLHLSLWRIQNRFEKQAQCIWTRIAFDGELQRRVTRISERIDSTPNETKEVSLQKKSYEICWYIIHTGCATCQSTYQW